MTITAACALLCGSLAGYEALVILRQRRVLAEQANIIDVYYNQLYIMKHFGLREDCRGER